MEEKNILLLCGRKMAEEPTNEEPSNHKQDDHYLLKNAQESRYMVAVISPHSALGLAVAQELHDQTCGCGCGHGESRRTCLPRETTNVLIVFMVLIMNPECESVLKLEVTHQILN